MSGRSVAITEEAESVIEAELDHVHRLVDADIPPDGVGFAESRSQLYTGLSSNQCDSVRSEIQVVVLDLSRPVVEQTELEAGARHPAPAIVADVREDFAATTNA
jgi:hypothetical protein